MRPQSQTVASNSFPRLQNPKEKNTSARPSHETLTLLVMDNAPPEFATPLSGTEPALPFPPGFRRTMVTQLIEHERIETTVAKAWGPLRTSTRLTLILLLLLHSSVSKFNPQGKSCSDIDASASFECFSVALMQGQGTAARGG